MTDIKKNFAKNLNYYLDTTGNTQLALSEYLGVSSAAVNYWCKGQQMPRLNKIDDICSFLGISRNELLSEKTLDITSAYQKKAIESMLKLNIEGQKKVSDYAEDLTENPRYRNSIADEQAEFTLAAHRKNNGNVYSEDADIAIHDIIEAARKKKDNKED